MSFDICVRLRGKKSASAFQRSRCNLTWVTVEFQDVLTMNLMHGLHSTVSKSSLLKYADITRNTPDLLKSIAHSRRLEQAAKLVELRPDQLVFDYGCGDGAFFEELIAIVPSENLFGFDPWLLDQMDFQGATTFVNAEDAIAQLGPVFDVLYCMEVCEHLSPVAIDRVFCNMMKLAKSDALFVFGVPLETGLPGALKNLYRMFKGGRQGADLKKLFRALFSLPIVRYWEGEWCGSHIGFNSKQFEKKLKESGFVITAKAGLPIRALGGFLNNEIYFICTRAR